MGRRPPRWSLAVIGLAVVAAGLLLQREALRADQRARKYKAEDNLRSLVSFYLAPRPTKPWPALTGKRFVLLPFATRQIDAHNAQNLEILFSPGDTGRSVEQAGGPPAFSVITLASLGDPAADFSRFTSYAGPARAPAEPSADAAAFKESGAPILADLSFDDFAIVSFTSGHTRIMTKADLGLAPTDPIVAGPASKSAILRSLSDE